MIVVSTINKSPLLDSMIKSDFGDIDSTEIGSEGFVIESIAGGDDSGTLYGCLELADRIKKTGALPENFHFKDKPSMVLRGTCIGMQRPDFYPDAKFTNIPIHLRTFHSFMTKSFGRNIWT